MSQGIGKLKEREKDRGTASLWHSQNTYLWVKFTVSPTIITVKQRSLVPDHHNRYNNNDKAGNTVELPKSDKKT